MKLAILSDTHDHVWHMRRAVQQANECGAEAIIHCGDLVSPFMLEEMDGFAGTLHLVAGNNPGDQGLLVTFCLAREGQVEFHGWLGRLEIGGISLAVTHDPHIARSIARSGEFDLVCFGHTHRWHKEKVNASLLLNPGEILGRKERPGWALVETDDLSVQHILLDGDGDKV